MTLRYLTAGESHGPALTGILEGMPAGVVVCPQDFTSLMRRRLAGYGRGRRAQFEPDRVEIFSGLIGGLTTGSPIALQIRNADYERHVACMHPFNSPAQEGRISVPLPGHADFAGTLKYCLQDCRLVRERASARETAMRTALSVPARCLLGQLGIGMTCFVERIGPVRAEIDYSAAPEKLAAAVEAGGDEFLTPDSEIMESWRSLIDKAAAEGTSLGGTGAVIFWGLPVGLGSHVHYDRRLDAAIAGLVMSIPAVRGVELGLAADLAAGKLPAADSVVYNPESGFSRGGNIAAGLEGGMTNGQPLIIRFHMKPLPANARLDSVNLVTMDAEKPAFYRSDIQAVTAAAVVAESIVAILLASEILTLAGGDSLSQIKMRLAQR